MKAIFKPFNIALAAASCAALLWGFGAADVARAQSAPRAAPTTPTTQTVTPRVAAAFTDWLAQNSHPGGTLALRRDGKQVTIVAQGSRGQTPAELASLSKSITALCLAELVREGRVEMTAPVSAYLQGGGEMRLGDLAAHAAGITADRTQRKMPEWLDDTRPRWANVTDHALDRGANGAREKFHYSNENYAILGRVIEAASGKPYEETCRARVLAPAGVTGRASPRTGAFLPWGGWMMTAGDFAALIDHGYGAGGPLARIADWPRVKIDGPVHYGMGMMQRDMPAARGGGTNLWHFGALCFPDRLMTGSYAVRFANGWTVAAVYGTCPSMEQMLALDAAIVAAIFEGP
ncbi:serine hydrolase domain-containing protein [Litorivita sp. NS0012-18]|uniref:serine hydrolase domain-containing protein n=1 Tax=Litorivita sp. NS0012-18 TaxID=3127655 RepID=UPI0031041E45